MVGSDCHASDQEQLRWGSADSSELEILAKVFNEHCKKHRIVREDEREQIAVKVMCLFRRGVIDPDRLAEELEG